MITVKGHSYVAQDHEEYFDPVVEVGNFSSVAEKVVFCGAMNHVWVTHKRAVSVFPFASQLHLDYFEKSVSRGPIIIGNDVWIGREAFLVDGITIGDGAVIGARAVVAKDIPPYAVVVGNPGQIHHFRYSNEEIEKLLAIKWWDWDIETIQKRIMDFHDIDVFLHKYYEG